MLDLSTSKLGRRDLLRLMGLSLLIAGCGASEFSALPPPPANSNSNNPSVLAVTEVLPDTLVRFDQRGYRYELQRRICLLTKLDPQGRVVWTTGTSGLSVDQLDTPSALGIDDNQSVWVVDKGLARVQVYDSDGRFLRNVGEGQLFQPRDIGITAGRAFVTDAIGHLILVFDLQGQTIHTISPAGLNEPHGIAIDPQGRLHVIDSGNHRILLLSQEGALLNTYGRGGGGSSEFVMPISIAIRLSDGLIAVADAAERDIELFNADLTPSRNLPLGGSLQPVDIEFSPTGNLLSLAEEVSV